MRKTLSPTTKKSIALECQFALGHWDSEAGENNLFVYTGWLNICRMLVWMENGGYPTDNVDAKEVNEICLGLLKEMNLKPLELKEHIQLMIYDSPFKLEAEQMNTIEKFLRTLKGKLNA